MSRIYCSLCGAYHNENSKIAKEHHNMYVQWLYDNYENQQMREWEKVGE